MPIINDRLGYWKADCPACGKSFDIAEVGHIRKAAVSYGLRRSMRCPSCGKTSCMPIQHVDRNGEPDQPLGYVLKRVLFIHAIVWGSLFIVWMLVW